MSRFPLEKSVRKLSEAEGYLMLGLPHRTLEILAKRSDWGGHQFLACYLEGEALRALDRCREALEKLEKAQSLRPDDADVAIALAWCYKRTHRLAQAIDALERVKKKHPDIALIHYNLACYWSLAGQPDRSLSELLIALGLSPEMIKLIPDEPDFDPIRNDPRFRDMIASSGGVHS